MKVKKPTPKPYIPCYQPGTPELTPAQREERLQEFSPPLNSAKRKEKDGAVV